MAAGEVQVIKRSCTNAHRRPEYRTTRLYGEYDPGYLRDAADAIDEYIWELNHRTDRDLFAPDCCKTVASEKVNRLEDRKRNR
jgi:hypothetical protein